MPTSRHQEDGRRGGPGTPDPPMDIYIYIYILGWSRTYSCAAYLALRNDGNCLCGLVSPFESVFDSVVECRNCICFRFWFRFECGRPWSNLHETTEIAALLMFRVLAGPGLASTLSSFVNVCQPWAGWPRTPDSRFFCIFRFALIFASHGRTRPWTSTFITFC